jgi:hypothetical protein
MFKMHGKWHYLLISVVFMALSSSQTLDVDSCVGPLTAAPNCDFYGSKLTACNSLRGSAAASCYCPQTVFDAVVRYVKTQEMLEFEKQFFFDFLVQM